MSANDDAWHWHAPIDDAADRERDEELELVRATLLDVLDETRRSVCRLESVGAAACRERTGDASVWCKACRLAEKREAALEVLGEVLGAQQLVDDAHGPLGELGVTYRREHGKLAVRIGERTVGLIVVRDDEVELLELLAYSLAGNGAREVERE